MAKITFGNHRITLPGSRGLRIGLGICLILGGTVGFLPVVGFWMIPLGLLVLSVDSPLIRRGRRRLTVKLGHWLKRNFPALAKKLGLR